MGIRVRPARRTGLALLTMLLALLVAAFVMDRLVAAIERDRSDATGSAIYRQVRMIAEAASVTGSDPVAGGLLPHVTVRRRVDYEYRVVTNGDDVLIFSWPSLPSGAATALGNRIGEWLGRDRVVSPLILALGEVPVVRAELVRRSAPDIHTDLEAAGLRDVGTAIAVSGRWMRVRTESAAKIESAAAGEVSVQGTAVGRAGSISGQIGGAESPVSIAVTVPSGAPTQATGTLRAGQLDVSLTLAAEDLAGGQVTMGAGLGARILVPVADELIGLGRASVSDAFARSARAHGKVSVEELTIRQECVGCAP